METNGEIDPNIPKYMSTAPWYVTSDGRPPSLDHQRRKRKPDPNNNSTKSWYERGATTFRAEKYRKGACDNCGAITHDHKSCVERPRALGAKYTGKNIAPDEKIETVELDYDAKRDRWNGFDAAISSNYVNQMYEDRDQARIEFLKEQHLKNMVDNKNNNNDNDHDSLKVDESKQKDFAKVEKRVRTGGGGGSTGSVRNLRIREDPAKYLLNLDVNSAYYDPKTRSMREDPLPHMDPSDKYYGGDNQNRVSGQALELKQLDVRVREAFENGGDVHVQGGPSQAELYYKSLMMKKDKLRCQRNEILMDKYDNAADTHDQDVLPRELLMGQTENDIEYDRAGRTIKGHETTT